MVKKFKVIFYCGPDGGGKDYLAGNALQELLELTTIPMVTTREPRDPKVETKIPVSSDAYAEYKKSGNLLGDHINRGSRYAYLREHLIKAKEEGKQGALLEINPAVQAHLLDELSSDEEIQVVGWIGLTGDEEYFAHNIKSRDNSPEDVILAKIEMARQISEAISEQAQKGNISLFRVGWENRETMHTEFIDLVKQMLSV